MATKGQRPSASALLVVAACFLCHMGLGYQYVFGPLQGPVTEELELGRGAYAAAAQARNQLIALLSPLVGILVVRFGARPMLTISIVLLCAGAFLMSESEGYWGLIGAIAILGLGITGVGDVTVGHAVTQWVHRGRGMALGFLYAASNIAGVLLVPLVTAISVEESWREAMRFAAGFTLLLLLPAALVRRPPARFQESEAEGIDTSQPAMDLSGALRTRTFWVLIFMHITYFAFAVAVTEHLVIYLTDQGLTPEAAAARWSTAIGLGIASKLGFGLISDWIPARRSLALLLGLLTLSSALLLLAPAEPYLAIFVVVHGLAYAARDVVTPLVVIECFGLRYMAQVYGAIFPTLLVGGGLGAILSGLCYDHLGTYTPAFAALLLLNLASLCMIPLLRREI